MAWRIILFFLGLCGVETVFGQTDSVAVRLQQVKLAENDSVRLKYADEISGYLEKIPYGQYAQHQRPGCAEIRQSVNGLPGFIMTLSGLKIKKRSILCCWGGTGPGTAIGK